MDGHRSPAALDFARGLLFFAWVALTILGPFALLLTWWGDCFEEPCPQPTALDGAMYVVDLIAWVLATGVLVLLYRRSSTGAFVVVGLVGAWVSAQAIAGLLGYRGLYFYGVLLPVSVMAVAGAALGAVVTRGRAAAR